MRPGVPNAPVPPTPSNVPGHAQSDRATYPRAPARPEAGLEEAALRRTAVLLATALAVLLAAAAPVLAGPPTLAAAGAVTILQGLVEGSLPSGGQQFTQGRVAGGVPDLLDNFGAALA